MPELPEVETTKRGIEPHIVNTTLVSVTVRESRLRWPVPETLQQLVGQTIDALQRRSKYIYLHTQKGTIMIHLGMSGSLRICSTDTPIEKHDHVDLVFSNGKVLRYRDPRRFGSILWAEDPQQHKLIKHLGPEPLTDSFNADYLFALSRNKKVAIKIFIMDAKRVVGVGNIYANEALFKAAIHPEVPAGELTLERYQLLVMHIKQVLEAAITQGGTTLRDFVREDGQSGYFQLQLDVYGRTGEPCKTCGQAISQIKQAQRSTFYCAHCQYESAK